MENLTINKTKNHFITQHYESELKKYCEARKQKNSLQAWGYLQRAHILSQEFAFLHTAVHVEMIKYALAEKNWKELRGQIPRLFLAGIGSLMGRAPRGNPGTSDYGIFKKHPIPQDLAQVLGNSNITQ